MKVEFEFYFKNGTVVKSEAINGDDVSAETARMLLSLFGGDGYGKYETLNIGGVIADVDEMVALKMIAVEE